MKKYSWVFGVFIMILCIGFGLFFPNIVFSSVLNEIRNRWKNIR